MRKFTKSLLTLALCALVGSSTFAQLSKGGSPYSFANAVQPKSTIQTKVLPEPDLTVVLQEDAVNDALDKPYRVGLNFPVNYNVTNSGTWENTPDGGSMWRLKIHMDDAKAISLHYHNFFLPTGGKVFIYNEYDNHVIGAFTSDYNYQDQIRATQMIQGNTITLEYYAPAGVVQTPIIEIKEVVYYYRGVDEFVKPFDLSGSSPLVEKAENCQVDVACTPESTGWADQINSVVHYVFTQGASSYVCSAAMINNTSQDCTPYILSAWHCGEPTAGQNLSGWVWYWNYQKTTCSPGSGNGSDPSKGSQTMTGGTVRASSGSGTLNNPPGTNQLAGSDFYLVELNSQPPTAYNAYYAGWDRTNTAATSGKGIHHPAGSAKKISTYTSSLTSSTYNGGASNAHWTVVWSATTNGHGVTEGGSSGSPIFNQSKRIVGQLSGGSSYCTATSSPDLYGKLYTDWDLCGTTNGSRLQPWLDPTNTGATVMDGAYQPCSSTNPPTCAINASATSVTVGGSASFTDGSTGVPTSWAWDFDNTGLGGASPSTSTSQNPGTVTFSNIGTYEVELIATNANGSCTTTVNIVVGASTGCDTLLNINDTNTLTIYGSNSGFITGANDYGDLAKAEKYTGYSPYTHVTGSDIYFYGVQDGGNGATVDLTIWADNAGLPGTVLGTTSYLLSDINSVLTGGQGLVFLPFDAPVNVGGADFYIGVDMSSFGAGDTIGIVSKMYNVATPANTGYEQWSDGTWIDMTSGWGVGDWSMYITAHVTDLPVSGSASASPTTVCVGETVTLTATGSNITSQTWYTTGASPTTGTTASLDVTYAAAGTYMAYLVLDGSCEGQIIDSVQVTVTSGPTVSSTPADPTCAGNDGTITVTATGGTTPYQYSIDGGATFQSSGSFTGLADGNYNIVVESATGCQGTDAVTLSPSAGGLTVSAAPTDPSCGASDGQIVVTATGGSSYTYSIDGGATFQASNTFTGLAVGSYNVVALDGGGCQGTTTVSLANAGGPTAAASGTNLSCNGAADGTITITGTGGTPSYTYSIDGSTFGASATFTGLAAGTYTAYVEDNNGCQSTASVTLTQPAAVSHNATATNATCGSSNGTVTVTATGGQSPYSYSLNGGTGQSSGSFTGLAAGSYSVLVTDANGCVSTSSSVTVGGGSAPTLSVSNTNETCMSANGQLVISASGGSTPYQYSIDGGATFQSGATFSGLSAGSFAVVVQDGSGCTTNSTATLTNTGGFTLSVNPSTGQTICVGNSANISASGAGTGATYTWDQGLGTGASHIVSPTVTTTYSVVATDGSGCSSTASTTITVQTAPTVTVIPTNPSICSGETVSLTATGATSYVWNTGATTSTVNVSPTTQTQYTVIGQNGSCAGTPVQVTVAVSPSPTVNAGSDVTSIQVGGTVNFNNSGSSATSYSWNFGDGQSSTQGFVAHTYNVAGTYTVILTGTIGSCTDADTLTINVGVSGIDQVSLENAVNVYPNPNNGKFNLKLNLVGAQDVEIYLFSAIGQLVNAKQLQNVSETIVEFDMTAVAEGIYLIQVKTEAGTVTKRITVSK